MTEFYVTNYVYMPLYVHTWKFYHLIWILTVCRGKFKDTANAGDNIISVMDLWTDLYGRVISRLWFIFCGECLYTLVYMDTHYTLVYMDKPESLNIFEIIISVISDIWYLQFYLLVKNYTSNLRLIRSLYEEPMSHIPRNIFFPFWE